MKNLKFILLTILISSCSMSNSNTNHKGNAYSKQFYAFAKDQMHDPEFYEFVEFKLDTITFEDLPDIYYSIGMDEEQIEEALKTSNKEDQYAGKIKFRAKGISGGKMLQSMTIYYNQEMKIDRIVNRSSY